MTQPVVQSVRPSALEWPVTVVAGSVLAYTTLTVSGVQTGQHIFPLVLCIILIASIARAIQEPATSRVPIRTGLILLMCLGATAVLWAKGYFSSQFIAATYLVALICASNLRSTCLKILNGPTLVLSMTAVMMLVLRRWGDVHLEVAILLMCLTGLVIGLGALSFSAGSEQKTPEHRNDVTLMLSSGDVWLVLVLLPATQASIYFAARLLTLLLPASLVGFERSARPTIIDLRRHAPRVDFVSAMARINLGLFLIAGAVALILLTAMTTVFPQLFEVWPNLHDTMLYLLAAGFVPAALGQTSVLDRLALPQRVTISGFAVGGVSATVVLALQPSIVAHSVALAFCAYRISSASVSCFYMIKNEGLWPGPTALFAGQIRLFNN